MERVKVPNKDDHAFWNTLQRWAVEAGSDGCTDAPDFYVECCWYHDHCYRTGKTFDGVEVSKAEADTLFRECIQSRSKLGRFSPISWIYWAVVKRLGRGVWSK